MIRPTFLAATLDEPFPGWTDQKDMIGGLFMSAGLGLMKEIQGDQTKIVDLMPVDLVAN